MTLSTFDDLLQASRSQPQPQTLLMVFAGVELPPDCSAEERARFEQGQGGSLTPRMCLDRSPDALSDWDALVREADTQSADWRMAFVGALGGSGGRPPGADAVDRALNGMVPAIHQGQIQAFAVFDREGAAVRFD